MAAPTAAVGYPPPMWLTPYPHPSRGGVYPSCTFVVSCRSVYTADHTFDHSLRGWLNVKARRECAGPHFANCFHCSWLTITVAPSIFGCFMIVMKGLARFALFWGLDKMGVTPWNETVEGGGGKLQLGEFPYFVRYESSGLKACSLQPCALFGRFS